MKFYLATGPSGRQVLFTRKDEALKIDKDAEQTDIPTDQDGLKSLIQESLDTIRGLKLRIKGLELRLDAGANEEGIDTSEISEADEEFFEKAELKKPTSYTEWSIDIDKAFEALPLAHQLNLAQLALENARNSEALCRAGVETPMEVTDATD